MAPVWKTRSKEAVGKGSLADPHTAELLRTVAVVVEEARKVLHPAVIGDWLGTPQYELDGRTTVEALREDQLTSVLQAVTATEYGAYG